MAIPNLYKSLRPLMILCYCIGQFAVVCVMVERSDLLRYHRLSKSLIGLFLQVGVYTIGHLWDISIGNISSFIVNVKFLYYVVVCIKKNSLFFWFYLGSKNIVQAIHAVDRMRENLTLIPSYISSRLTKPRAYLWYIVAIFFFSLTMEIGVTFSLMTEGFNIYGFVIIMLWGNALLVQAATLVSLFDCCSLVIEDTFRGWLTDSIRSFPPIKSLKTLCYLILNQLVILEEVNRALGKHILVILVVRIIELLEDALLLAEVDYAEEVYVKVIVWWSFCLGFLLYSVNHVSAKMDRVTLEMLCCDLNGISKREAVKVKMLMTQLQTRPKFTAAGFADLNPELFLTLLSMGIDYLILLWQNKTFIRNVLSSKNLMTLANLMLHNQ